jgi:hypothetical protein
MSYFAHHFVGVRVGKENQKFKDRKIQKMKLKSLSLMVIAILSVLLTSATPASAQNYRYRGDAFNYGYQPRTQVVTQKVYYRDYCGRLYVRYEQVVIPSHVCVAEVYEPAYYHGSYTLGGGFRQQTNIRLPSPRLPNLPRPQPHKHIEEGARKVGDIHKKHKGVAKKGWNWVKNRF